MQRRLNCNPYTNMQPGHTSDLLPNLLVSAHLSLSWCSSQLRSTLMAITSGQVYTYQETEDHLFTDYPSSSLKSLIDFYKFSPKSKFSCYAFKHIKKAARLPLKVYASGHIGHGPDDLDWDHKCFSRNDRTGEHLIFTNVLIRCINKNIHCLKAF